MANLFTNNCKQLIGVDPKLMVAIGNMSSEISRSDKLCIYAENVEQAKQYIEILEKIKNEKKDLEFRKPILTTGTIDNWIGIGSNNGNHNTSYNKEICQIITDSCNKYFSNMNNTEIMEQLNSNPKLLEDVRNSISEKCSQNGMSFEKICVREEDVELLKKTKLSNIELDLESKDRLGEKTIDEIVENEITLDDISDNLMNQLHEKGYDGKSGHPVIQSYYQLYFKNENAEQKRIAQDNKIAELENKSIIQNDEIEALKSRSDMFENTIRNQSSKIRNIKNVLETLNYKINDLQENVRPKSFIEKIKNIFTKKQKFLPVTGCEIIDNYVKSVQSECNSAERVEKQNLPQSIEDFIAGRAIIRERTKLLEKEKTKRNKDYEGLVFPQR